MPDQERRSSLVPPVLATMAAWGWRLLVLGAVVYYLLNVISILKFVFLSCAIGLLLTGLLYPLFSRLRRIGLGPMAATWLSLLTAFVVIIGTGVLIGVRANEEFPQLARQVQKTGEDIQGWLTAGPFHLKEAQLQQWFAQLAKQFEQPGIAGQLLTGATVAVEVLASIILVLFITFFLLKDGAGIWKWFLKAFGRVAPRVDRAGRVAWRTLSSYVQGTVAVAAIHGVAMAIVLVVMGVPLWAPLAVLIFLASFIPVVGILFAGGLASLIVLSAKGWILALVFVGILIIEQQIENHLLQPLVVGRAVRFHPLAIILVLAIGGTLAGIPGAAVAVPVAAVIYRALPELRPERPGPKPPAPPAAEPGPPKGGPKAAAKAVSSEPGDAM
ncbi:AI-2E family transporter [Rhizohabitans arisaemae]|uniref:AI-2E family transporter n=1 Tax=Rhizohabitans arisaemae TaxID=2720610 RepID=UPI0024B17416|nr:AI-2E family transporter [Rhizohabitans arisaemae]